MVYHEQAKQSEANRVVDLVGSQWNLIKEELVGWYQVLIENPGLKYYQTRNELIPDG